MKYCPQCGASLDDAAVLCPHCGNTQQAAAGQYAQPGYGSPYYTPAAVNYVPDATRYIVWSIIVLLFTKVFGVLGLVFSIMAKNDKTPEEAQSHLKIAKIMCIIGTVVAALVVLLLIAYFVFIGFMVAAPLQSGNWTNG